MKRAATSALDIGDTYYDAGIYDPAIQAYEKALVRHTGMPGMSQAIETKIQRSKRNIRRNTFGRATLAVVCLIPLFIVLMPPKGIYFWGGPSCCLGVSPYFRGQFPGGPG